MIEDLDLARARYGPEAVRTIFLADGNTAVLSVRRLEAIGRATQGVRIITMKPGDQLVSIARVASEDSDQQNLPFEPDKEAAKPVDATDGDANASEPATPPADTDQ